MAVKPSNLAEWGTGSAPIVEPTLVQKQNGWTSGFKPPAQWFNWWMNLIYQWIVWLNAFEGDPHTWASLQTFSSANVTTLGAGTIAATGPSTFGDTVSITGVLTLAARAVANLGLSLVGTSSVEALTMSDSSAGRKLLLKVQVQTISSVPVYVRVYTAPPVAGATNGFGAGLEFTYNQSWNGSVWVRDSSTPTAGRVVIGQGIAIWAGVGNNAPIALLGARDDGAYPSAFYNGATSRQMLVFDAAGTLRVGTEQVQDPFTNITLAGNNTAVVGNTPRFFRDSMGVVHLSGQSQVISGFAGGTQVATMPSTALPDRVLTFPFVQDLAGVTKFYTLTIDGSGVVALQHLSGGAALAVGEVIQFEGITYKAV